MPDRCLRPSNLPSLSVAQGEIARYSRTGDLLHLAHATRAMKEALQELHVLRQRALANSPPQTRPPP
jgi:hypothetical protein